MVGKRGYWATAVRRAWDTFSLHTGVAGLILPLLTGAFGYFVGAQADTIGVWRGVLGGVAVACAYYVIILLVVTPRQLWNETQNRLIPRIDFRYDSENSLFIIPAGETYRLRVSNTGVQSISGVWVRVVDVQTAPYLKGILPISLRRQHGGDAPFTLNDTAPLFIDFLEAANGPINVTQSLEGHTQEWQTMLALLCNDGMSPQAHLMFGREAHVIEIEIQGVDVPTCRKKLRVQLPAKQPITPGEGRLEISNI